jgi:hypothetical protein
MDIALEFLDFLNFDLQDEKAFKKLVNSEAIVPGVRYPYEVYNRLMALAEAPFNRTSQLVKEWLTMRRGSCEFREENGVHVYLAPPKQKGIFKVRVEKDNCRTYCHAIRVLEWEPDIFAAAQLSGPREHAPLEVLIGSMHHWAQHGLSMNEVKKEVDHYFMHLACSSKPPYDFGGFLNHGRGSVLFSLSLRTIADSLEASADMINYSAR